MAIFRTKMLSIFYNQLSTFVKSGVPIIETMNILATRGGSIQIKRAALEIKKYLVQGISLGEAFLKFPDIFPAWQVDIIKYSEKSGRLGEDLERLADYLEKDYATVQSIIVGLAYPVVLLHAAIFMLPIVDSIACGFDMYKYIIGVLKLLIPVYGSVFLIYFARRLLKLTPLKNSFDGFILFIPILGRVVRQVALTRFIRALQCLCASGATITSAWEMAASACGNNVIKNAILNGLPLIAQGQGISKAFIQARVFTPDMISLISVAQESGSIVGILNTIGNYCEKENETVVAVLTKIMPVFAYLAVASYIGFRVISFYLSYFDKISSF